MPHNRFKNDPHWTLAKNTCMCDGCGRIIKRAESIFYYPAVKKSYCSDGCGDDQSAEFKEAAEAEYAVTGPEQEEMF